MLEAITDFWKPMKKGQPEPLQPELLQVGSTLGFGFVPQAILSGRRLTVSAVNTYQFGDEALTSFILTQEKDPGVSMIVAESEGEQYLAISRRISAGDRMKLFTSLDLDNVMTRPEAGRLPCNDNAIEYKGWVVASYKREIQGLKGRIFKGDFRKKTLPAAAEAQEFEYFLLVSESNEHAIEIEKYGDGRIEVYATVYRRMNDIGEITHPFVPAAKDAARPDIKLASQPQGTPPAAAPPVASPVISQPPKVPEAPTQATPEAASPRREPAPIKLQELTPPPVVNTPEPSKPEPAMKAAPVTNAMTTPPEKPPVKTTAETINPMRNDMNANAEFNAKPKLYVQPSVTETYSKQETKTVTNGAANHFDSDAIECDLRVANKIIDAAIRDEMRLTDVVRRIIELPVANQESVQIPVTLTDEDYALLAIRYGISSSDRNSIKRRIIEDLNEFSGGKKAA